MSETQQFGANKRECLQPWPDQVWIDAQTGEEIILPPRNESYVFGDPNYPISKYRDFIVDTIRNNEVTVIKSGTGNGKSISIVQFLYETGEYRRIVQTQTRVVATRENERFTVKQMSEAADRDMSDTIAYRTALEGDEIHDSHVIREYTDGYVLQMMLREGTFTDDDVLIIDEAHERNTNIDIISALAHQQGVRLVILSATIDTDKWAKYSSEARGGIEVPVLDLPGVMYPVETKAGGFVHDEVMAYANQDTEEPLNISVLTPGKREIGDVIGRVTHRVPKEYTILPAHAEQSAEEQDRAMRSYDDGKVVAATDILRQSLTIPDLNVMIDSMYARSGDYRQGIRFLRVGPVSEANIIQGMGRVGRTQPGTYVQARLPGYPPIPRDEQGNLVINKHDTPAILRTKLSPHLLRLACAGLTFGDLPLQDVPRSDEIEYGYHELRRLGAQVLGSIHVTEIGEKMAKLPLEPSYARMFIESQKYSKRVELQMAAIASIMQQDGITMSEYGHEQWRYLTDENRSDMLVQLDVLTRALEMKPADLKRFNIIDRRITKARRVFNRISEGRGYSLDQLERPSEEERQQLIACMIAGADKLFVNYGAGYTDGESFNGRLAKSTSLPQNAPLVIGSGLVIEHYRNEIKKSHSVITGATIVTPEQLVAYAPHRCSYGEGRVIQTRHGKSYAGRDLYFDGHATRASVRATASHETTKAILESMIDGQPHMAETSEKVHAILGEFSRIKHLLVDRSDSAEEYEQFVEMVRQHVLSMKDVKVVDMYALADVMHGRRIFNILQKAYTPDSAYTQNIMEHSPDVVTVWIDDEFIEVNVQYKNNEAYLDVPVHRIKGVSDYGLVEQLGDRPIRVWIDGGKKHHKPLQEAIDRSVIGNRAVRRAVRRTR